MCAMDQRSQRDRLVVVVGRRCDDVEWLPLPQKGVQVRPAPNVRRNRVDGGEGFLADVEGQQTLSAFAHEIPQMPQPDRSASHNQYRTLFHCRLPMPCFQWRHISRKPHLKRLKPPST